jgi:hypothetical protein
MLFANADIAEMSSIANSTQRMLKPHKHTWTGYGKNDHCETCFKPRPSRFDVAGSVVRLARSRLPKVMTAGDLPRVGKR